MLVPGRVLLAHTPYRQWQVYRQRHLMIGASREDTASYPKAKAIQAFLDTYLPEASARVARARTRQRLADLLATDQIRIVLLSLEDAEALGQGRPPFRSSVEVRTLWRFGDHLMVVRPTFPPAHAWMLARVFAEHGSALAGASPAPAHGAIPPHEGVRVARDGGPCPHLPWTPSTRAVEARTGTDPCRTGLLPVSMGRTRAQSPCGGRSNRR